MSSDPLALVDADWKDKQFDYHLIQRGDTLPDLDGLTIAVDVETMPVARIKKAGLSAFHGAILGVSVGCPEKGQCWYAPLRHRAPGSDAFNVPVEPVVDWLRGITSKARLLVNQNLKFDAKFCDRAGVDAHGYDHVPLFDTQIASVLIDEREQSALKPTCARLLGMPPDEQEAVEQYIVGSKDNQDWSYCPADVMAPYGCGDVERTLRLAGLQKTLLAREGVEDLFRLEMNVLRDLIHAEIRGHRVDVDLLKKDLPDLIKEEIIAARRVEKLIGASVNPNSPKELADALVTRLSIPILVTKPGTDREGNEIQTPVFDDAALQLYARTYPQYAELFFLIRKARRLEHVKGFVQAYFELQVDGVIHTTIKQVEARTGRESSEMPNLQQITGEERWDDPTAEPGSPWIAPGCEKYFIAREGYSILSADYSQVEYRFFAHYMADQRLIDAYRTNASLDMHEWVAKEILNGMIDRDDAKSANFGIVFGMGEKKLVKYMAQQGVGISEQQAAQALMTYHDRVPGLKMIQGDVGRALTSRGYVRTILGRKRRGSTSRQVYGKKRDKKADRGLLPYQALNAICQGGAVDLLKDRSVAANRVARKHGGMLLLKIHDDCKFEIPTDALKDAAREIHPVLETFVKPDGSPYLKVPIYTKMKSTSTSWYDAEPLNFQLVTA